MTRPRIVAPATEDALDITAPEVSDAPDTHLLTIPIGLRLVELPIDHPAVLAACRWFRHELHLAPGPTPEGRTFAWVQSGRLVAALGVDTDEDGPFLDWAWTHPSLRRRGLLRAAWTAVEALYGRLGTSEVLSAAMGAFYATLPPDRRPHPEASR